MPLLFSHVGFVTWVCSSCLLSVGSGARGLVCLSNALERFMNLIRLLIPLNVPVSLPHWAFLACPSVCLWRLRSLHSNGMCWRVWVVVPQGHTISWVWAKSF